jgi:hypothetical protein
MRKPELPDCIEGVMLIDGIFYGYTLELPWRANLPDVSCIPCGVYQVQKALSEHFTAKLGHDVFLPHILDVPGRLGVLIHGGNKPSDSLGCVLVGSHCIGPGEIAGSLSNDLTLRMGDGLHRLEILQATGS